MVTAHILEYMTRLTTAVQSTEYRTRQACGLAEGERGIKTYIAKRSIPLQEVDIYVLLRPRSSARVAGELVRRFVLFPCAKMTPTRWATIFYPTICDTLAACP